MNRNATTAAAVESALTEATEAGVDAALAASRDHAYTARRRGVESMTLSHGIAHGIARHLSVGGARYQVRAGRYGALEFVVRGRVVLVEGDRTATVIRLLNAEGDVVSQATLVGDTPQIVLGATVYAYLNA